MRIFLAVRIKEKWCPGCECSSRCAGPLTRARPLPPTEWTLVQYWPGTEWLSHICNDACDLGESEEAGGKVDIIYSRFSWECLESSKSRKMLSTQCDVSAQLPPGKQLSRGTGEKQKASMK